MPLYPDDKVKVSILPTDRSERDERTGIVTVIGFSPIRGQGLVKHAGFGYSRVEVVGRIQAVGGEPEAKFLKQVAQGVSEWDYVRWGDIAERPLQFPPEPHKHGLEDLLQSGAVTGQVIKFDGTNWTPSWVNWEEIDGKPSQFPPEPHTHSRSDITDFSHASTHASGGSDPITGNLDANARVTVKQSGTVVGTRRAINFIAGSNISLSISDDAVNEKVDVTISATGGGSSSHNLLDGVVHPDTEATTVTRGMLVVGKLSGTEIKWGGLPLGSSGNVLKSDGTDVTWGNVDWSEITNKPATFAPSPHTHDAADITTGRLSVARLPTSTTANQFLVVRTANSDPTYDVIQASDLPAHTHTRSQITDFSHAATHQTGGSDPITGNLDANARVGVMSAGTLVGTRRRINFIAGTNVTLNVVDDATNEKVDVTINAVGGGSGAGELFVMATAPPQNINANAHFVLARITVPTDKPNLKVIAVAVSPFLGSGDVRNARIVLFNETNNVAVATWNSSHGPVYMEPNQVFNLGGKTVSFRLSHGASSAQVCWGSVAFKLTP